VCPPWRRTAVNLINNRLRKLSRRPRTVALDEEPEAPSSADSVERDIDLVIVRLGPAAEEPCTEAAQGVA
jgi:DNA-directed RNA polymerase specialized sigma24 family protein